jgi:hypothetical protein
MNELDNKAAAVAKKQAADRAKWVSEQEKARQKEADDISKYLEEQEKQTTASVKKQLEEIAKLREDNHENQMQNIQLNAEDEELAIEEAFSNRLMTEQQRQDALYQLEVDRLTKQLDQVKSFYGASSKEAKEATNELNLFMARKRSEDVQNQDQANRQKKASNASAAQGSLSIASDVFGNLSGMYDDSSQEYRNFALIQGQIDTFNAALAAYRSTAAIPVVGPGLAPIAAAAAFAFGQAQQLSIRNVKKAEYGTFLHGRRHSQGGIPVEAEDGEIILNRNVGLDPVGLRMASELNAAYGGARFLEAGGPVNPFSAQQIAAQAPALSGGSTSEANDSYQKIMIAYMQKIDSYVSTLKVVNNVQDTREGLQVINTLEQDAGF